LSACYKEYPSYPPLLQSFLSKLFGQNKEVLSFLVKLRGATQQNFGEFLRDFSQHKRFFPRALYLQLVKLHVSGFFAKYCRYHPEVKCELFNETPLYSEEFDCDLFLGVSWNVWQSTTAKLPLTGSGMERTNHIAGLAERCILDNIVGDFFEAGVWRGGMLVVMAAVLARFGDKDRIVWGADSFSGLPTSGKGDEKDYAGLFSASEVAVKETLAMLSLTRVRLLTGWFSETLPSFKSPISLLRIDGDLYSSTMECLTCLYPLVSPGGFIVIDDFGSFPGCNEATLEFRKNNNITSPLHPVERTATWWKKD